MHYDLGPTEDSLLRLTGECQQPLPQVHVRPRQQMCGLSESNDFRNDTDRHCHPTDPRTIPFDLAKPPEGAAFTALEDVLHSGCLKINTLLPIDMSRALRDLYSQIEHLT